jgi:hypothetical protein
VKTTMSPCLIAGEPRRTIKAPVAGTGAPGGQESDESRASDRMELAQDLKK